MYRVNDFIQKIVKKAGEENKTDVSKFWKNVGEDQQLLVRVSLELIVAGIDESIINVVDIDKFIEKDIATLRFSNPEQIFDFVSKSFGEEIKEKLKAGGTPSSEIASAARRRRSVPSEVAEGNIPPTPEAKNEPAAEPAEEMYDGKKLSEYTESDFDANAAYYDFDHPEGNGILATLYSDADKPFSLDAEHTFLMMEDESKKVKLVKVPAINATFTEEVHTEGGQDILIRPQDRYVEGEERDIVYLDKSGVEGATLFKDLLYGLALGSMSNLKPEVEEHGAGSTTVETPAAPTPAVPAPEAAPEEEPADANVGSSNPTGKVITVTFKGGEYCLIDGKAKKKIKVRGSSPEGPVDLGDLAIPSATIKGEMIGHGYQVRNGYWNVESTDGTINKMCSDYELMYLQNVNSNLTITPVLEATGGGDHL